MKNIAIIITSLNSGGAERIAGLLSKELSKRYHVYLFTLSTKDIVYDYGGTIVDIGDYGAFYEYSIKRKKEEYEIDVAISFLEIMNFANIRTRGKERVICSERCIQSLIDPPFTAQSLKIKRYYPYADAIIACSYGVKYDMQCNYGIEGNSSVIYNFIDKQMILKRSEERLPDVVREVLGGKEFFLNVGRLHPQKNQKRLINQFWLFHQNNGCMKLIILGSGSLEAELRKQIEELDLTEDVLLLPYTANPFAYMKCAKALVLSSHYEGLPNAVLEAMTIGCPVIATDCLSGPRELLDEKKEYESKLNGIRACKRGILVCDSDTEDCLQTRYLADAMEMVLADGNLRTAFCASQKEYMDRYTNEDILKQWIEVIENKEKGNHNVLEDEESHIQNGKKVFIYGAGHIGTSYYDMLQGEMNIDGFVVTDNLIGAKEYLNVPIYEIESFPYHSDEAVFILGVSDNTQDEVLRILNQKGFTDVYFPFVKPFNEEFAFKYLHVAEKMEKESMIE